MKKSNYMIELLCISIAFILSLEANIMQSQGTLNTPKGFIIVIVGIIFASKALFMRYKRKPLK